jgi:hypothetical protein
MPNPVDTLTDVLAAPMEKVIVSLGTSVAQAQRELDRHSIESQKEIEADPTLSAAGVSASFYQIPKVELELTMTITMQSSSDTAGTAKRSPAAKTGVALGDVVLPRPARISVAPLNAFYTNQFGFQAAASSKLKLTIVPVPPAGEAT